MKAFAPDRSRNVAPVGPPGAGQTSLAGAVLYRAGPPKRGGRVGDRPTRRAHGPEIPDPETRLTPAPANRPGLPAVGRGDDHHRTRVHEIPDLTVAAAFPSIGKERRDVDEGAGPERRLGGFGERSGRGEFGPGAAREDEEASHAQIGRA